MTDFNPKSKKVLLYSGGMDSWLISKIWEPDVKLYIDINSSYSKEEISKLDSDVIVLKDVLNLHSIEREDKIIPLRNLYFTAIATNYGDEICLGATYGDRVLDKSPEFAQKAGELFSFLYQKQHWTEERNIRINVDFKEYTKRELLKMYLDKGGTLEEAWNGSFSCYFPHDGKPCFKCKPCVRKVIAFMLNGMKFSDDVLSDVMAYLKLVMTQIDNGTYGRGAKEENDIKDAYLYLLQRDIKPSEGNIIL